VETIAYACHTAYLNPLTGSGLLVRPRPELDLRTTGLAPSLHEADWNHAMRDLDARGWEPTESERGAIAVDSYMPDGREVIGLHGRHPIIAEPTIEQELESFAELRRLAGSA